MHNSQYKHEADQYIILKTETAMADAETLRPKKDTQLWQHDH